MTYEELYNRTYKNMSFTWRLLHRKQSKMIDQINIWKFEIRQDNKEFIMSNECLTGEIEMQRLILNRCIEEDHSIQRNLKLKKLLLL